MLHVCHKLKAVKPGQHNIKQRKVIVRVNRKRFGRLRPVIKRRGGVSGGYKVFNYHLGYGLIVLNDQNAVSCHMENTSYSALLL